MSIARAKSVDRLYRECRGHDLVLVPDPPLESALNRRLEEAHFGPFAITPRRLAAGRREAAEDRLAFLDVVRHHDVPWKEASYAVGNVLQCWEHQGSVDAILDYDAYVTPATGTVVERLRDLGTTSSRLEAHRIDDDVDVAVVGIEEFTALERSILPDDYHVIDPLVDEAYDPPPFRIFGSPAAIVDAVLDAVTRDNADRVAVVLDRGSLYTPLVEAALETAGIPFHGGQGFGDDPDHRTFLRLLRAAHGGSDLRIADVRPVLTRLGIDVDVAHDDKRVDALEHPGLEWFTGFADDIGDRTFVDALDAFEVEADRNLDAFREELDTLGLHSARVTEPAVGRLEFYLGTYEVPIEREDGGVLLADASTAATVDRPAVFYLGMDEGWTHDSPRRPWVDRDAEFIRHLRGFQRLLQNGVERYYLVLDERGGRAVTPCLYFEELFDEPFERFSDLQVVEHARRFRPTGDGFERSPVDVEPGTVETISQSGLNRLVNCPRDYLFGSLVDAPERDYLTEGTLFHDFAEVYANHPDRIDGAVLDDVVDLMLRATLPFASDVDRAVDRTRYRVGLETIVEFIDANPPVGAHIIADAGGRWPNAVAEHLGLSVDAPHTEWWFDDEELGLKGKIDLVRSSTAILDYKSGSRTSARGVVRRSALDPPHEVPEYQAMAYLTYLRSQVPDETLRFTFFHFLEILDDVVAGEGDLEDCLTTITYHPHTFAEHLTRESVYDDLLETGPGDCRRTFEGIDHRTFVEVMASRPFPEGDSKDDLLASPLGEELHRCASDIVGDYAYVENGCGQALRHLAHVRDSSYFVEDLDGFESFVGARLDEVNRYRSGEARVPVTGLGGEPNYRRVDHRDMLLEGEARP